MTVATLADVQKLLRHLPKQHRGNVPWRHVAAELDTGADANDVSIALRMALMLEGVPFSLTRRSQSGSAQR